MLDTTNKWAIRTQTELESEAIQRIASNFGYTTGDILGGTGPYSTPYVVFDPENKLIIPVYDNPEPYICQLVNRIEDAMNLLKNIPGNVGFVGSFVVFANGDVGHSQVPLIIQSSDFDALIAKREEVLSM